MGRNIHQKQEEGDSKSFGRWDDSQAGYMIALWAERYVNVVKGHHCWYQRVPENMNQIYQIYKTLFHGVTDTLEYGQWVIDGDLITCPRLSLNFQPCSYLSSKCVFRDFKKNHCNPALHHPNQQSPHSVVQFCPGGDPFVFVFHLCLYHCIVCIVLFRFFCTYEYNFSDCIASINRNRPVHFWPGVARSVSENR